MKKLTKSNKADLYELVIGCSNFESFLCYLNRYAQSYNFAWNLSLEKLYKFYRKYR